MVSSSSRMIPENEAAEQKIWAKYLDDAILASNKSFYSQSRQISVKQRGSEKMCDKLSP